MTDGATNPPPLTPIEQLGHIVTQAEEASEAARIVAAAVVSTTEELRQEKLWRKWARRFAAGLAGAVIVLVALLAAACVLVAVLLDRYGTLLDKVAADAKSCAKPAAAQTLGCENHAALVTIERVTSPQAQADAAAATQRAVGLIVSQGDCVTRRADADVLHAAEPQLHFTVPATAACPAYSPGP